MPSSSPVYFSKFLVTNQVFYKSKHSYALVNLKPLLPGHVLIVPLRNTCIRLSDLTPEENIDYFKTVQLIYRFIQHTYNADAMNIAIQDGPEAGQTVPHLHTHLIPRYRVNNIGDAIYDRLESWRFTDRLENWERRRAAYEANGEESRSQLATPDADRKPQDISEMSKEAEDLKAKLATFIASNSTDAS
ncbi:HBR324Cp [Eremothecium sinecaudum]|uniref:Bis(5'-adenosyl)-triphosphatase n=1 Tax=Eremothecium sinecaudum TaxID=45286 RepID=A0A125RE26_9SACH|nr:HBR324Cp [Eremothecium sinecaudum]AMD19225.1 HBR324Cp [Eremothecium sinecaudum]